ncbi:MAG: S9 family peptidase [Nitrospirales bacterium]|nr:S9 family peptidase [Nitrospirales bacterium]
MAILPPYSNVPVPPKARAIPHSLITHQHVRVDEYYWLRERDNPEVLNYLNAENEYAQAVLGHTDRLQTKLFEEIKGRIKEADLSVPFQIRDYWYFIRFQEGEEYPLYCRKSVEHEANEELMVDANELAKGHEYFSLGSWAVSSGQDILAFATDTQGRRIYNIQFKDLQHGTLLPDVIESVTGNMAWANDNRTLFYARQDQGTLRSYQIYRHVLGTSPSTDVLVYEERDETFSVFVTKSKSRRFLLVGSHQTITSEYHFLDADTPTADWTIFQPRAREHEYDVDHLGDDFYIRTNDQAKNFKLMKASLSHPDQGSWKEVIPHRTNVLLEGFELFKDYLVVEERRQGLVHFRIRHWETGEEHELDFGEPAYLATTGDNFEPQSSCFRFGYTSMTTPMTIYDYHMGRREKILLKQEEVLGNFQISHYQTERQYATSADGVSVPISLVYRKGFQRNGTHPLLLYGYGSYGASMDASFSSPRLSLLDRGFVFAIAHIRGGEELGRVWYEEGKLLKKKNTFTDFLACADYLVEAGYANPDRLFAMGGSAGGLLIGAVMNMRPDRFQGVVAQVPFVDVVTTMLDPDIPLTTGEYDEWGDPNQKPFYDYMLSYSPYDHVNKVTYPHILVTSGLHDSQVQYWEPTKWVAKLRAMKIDDHRLLLKTNMEAGHSGVSGRFQRYKETAFIYAFLLDLCGIES